MKKQQKKTKTLSPFKEKEELENEITNFMNGHKAIVSNQAKRISDFFEMSCFNYIVKFYKQTGFKIIIKNLIDNKYRYKCSSSGLQENFSYFLVQKNIDKIIYEFEIHHNLTAQSSHDNNIFTTPDISVVNKKSIKNKLGYYYTKRKVSYIENKNLISFYEVKHFNPFPELLFNFIGTLNELKKNLMFNNGTAKKQEPLHISPSLMISGKPNKQTQRIKESLENRYNINIFYDLFILGERIMSKKRIKKFNLIGTCKISKN